MDGLYNKMFANYSYPGFQCNQPQLPVYNQLTSTQPLFTAPTSAMPQPSSLKYKRTWKKSSIEALCQRCEAYCATWNKPLDSLTFLDFHYIAYGTEQSAEQCFLKYREIQTSGTLKPGVWCDIEEQLLANLVRNSNLKWGEIAKMLNHQIHKGLNIRTGKKCKEQWNNHLNPHVNKGPWQPEEDLAILMGYLKYGNRWSLIAKQTKGRIESNVKNQIKSLLNKEKQHFESSNGSLTPTQRAIWRAQQLAYCQSN